ncbi:Uncharacterised protein [Mycobacteroides abscessus subsp. abscessus]|nr:Uncharacterised protein [Mycobacteroides abscessus subsp. abscessus]
MKAADDRLKVVQIHYGSPIHDENLVLRSCGLGPQFESYLQLLFASALDHLKLFAATLRANGMPHLYAEYSLIRTSLTASSYALWLLLDDDDARRLNLLKFVFKDLDDLSSWARTDVSGPGTGLTDQVNGDGLAQATAKTQQSIVDEANAVERRRRGNDEYTRGVSDYKKERLTDSSVVGHASSSAAGASELLSMWKFMSGYAHGRYWPSLVTAVMTSEVGRLGVRKFTYAGDPQQLLKASHLALDVIDAALQQLETLAKPRVRPPVGGPS